MRVAVLGVGRIGRLHARLLARQTDVKAIVVTDLDPERAHGVAAEVGGHAVASIEEALDLADAVVIATATGAHAGLVRAALDRGLPTFCEKPLALDLTETADLVRRARRASAPLQVGFQRRFDPAYRAARRMIESGDLGLVYLVRLIAHDHAPPPEAYIASSGGLFRDSSIHDFDALRWMTGQEVEEVYATGSVRAFDEFARHGDVDTGAAILRLGDGTIAVLGQTRHDPRGYDVRMEIVGSRDSVVVGLGPRTPLRSLEAGAEVPRQPPWTDFLDRFRVAYEDELRTFIGVARDRLPSPCTAWDAFQAMRISDAASRSVASRRPIRLSIRSERPDRAAGSRRRLGSGPNRTR